MTKWKLFRKTKKEEKSKEIEIPVQKSEEVTEIIDETREEAEELPIKDYHETLYSKEQSPQKSTISPETSEKPWAPRRWEDAHAVEKKVDDIGKKRIEPTKKPFTHLDISRKIDRLLSKKKK